MEIEAKNEKKLKQKKHRLKYFMVCISILGLILLSEIIGITHISGKEKNYIHSVSIGIGIETNITNNYTKPFA